METHIEKDVQSKVIDILGIYCHYANVKIKIKIGVAFLFFKSMSQVPQVMTS